MSRSEPFSIASSHGRSEMPAITSRSQALREEY
jgi:hypothetical protein